MTHLLDARALGEESLVDDMLVMRRSSGSFDLVVQERFGILACHG